MPNNKDIFRNKKDFAHEEFATELNKMPGRPKPREIKSQDAQLESDHRHGRRKDVKTPMSDKT
jgi:hypothetical protein